MKLMNSSKNKLNNKINWFFNLEPNTRVILKNMLKESMIVPR